MAKNIDVKIEIIDTHLKPSEIENMIKGYLMDGYEIQNSDVQWYCGRMQGLYVFIKESDE